MPQVMSAIALAVSAASLVLVLATRPAAPAPEAPKTISTKDARPLEFYSGAGHACSRIERARCIELYDVDRNRHQVFMFSEGRWYHTDYKVGEAPVWKILP